MKYKRFNLFEAIYEYSLYTHANSNEYFYVKQIIESPNFDINKIDDYGTSGLILATRKGLVDIVKLLLDNGAFINHKDSNHMSALHYASKHNNYIIADMLINYGAEIDLTDTEGRTALFIAVQYHNVSLIKLLLDAGSNANIRNNNMLTPKMAAFNSHNDRKLIELLEKGACSESNYNQLHNGDTLLHLAAYEGNDPLILNIVKSKNINIDVKNALNESPLHLAVQKGNLNSIKLLIKYGAGLYSTNKHHETAMHIAIEFRNIVIMQCFVDQGIDINHLNKYSETFLFFAAGLGDLGAVNFLLWNGANPNICNVIGRSPLINAAINGFTDVVTILLKYGADVTCIDIDSINALHAAISVNDYITVKNLIAYGIDFIDINNDIESPLHDASGSGNTDIVRLLLKHGANANSLNKYNLSPLHKSTHCGNVQITRLLLNNEANINQIDNFGNSPLSRVIIKYKKILDSPTTYQEEAYQNEFSSITNLCKYLAVINLLIQHKYVNLLTLPMEEDYYGIRKIPKFFHVLRNAFSDENVGKNVKLVESLYTNGFKFEDKINGSSIKEIVTIVLRGQFTKNSLTKQVHIEYVLKNIDDFDNDFNLYNTILDVNLENPLLCIEVINKHKIVLASLHPDDLDSLYYLLLRHLMHKDVPSKLENFQIQDYLNSFRLDNSKISSSKILDQAIIRFNSRLENNQITLLNLSFKSLLNFLYVEKVVNKLEINGLVQTIVNKNALIDSIEKVSLIVSSAEQKSVSEIKSELIICAEYSIDIMGEGNLNSV